MSMPTPLLKHSARARAGLLIACLVALSGCVIEPEDSIWNPPGGSLKLWGFNQFAASAVTIEAINTSNAWEVVASTTTTSRITYTGTRSGYYWEVYVNINNLAARFKIGGQVRLRAKVGTWLMATHSGSQQRARVDDSPLVEFWNAYLSPTSQNSVITVWL